MNKYIQYEVENKKEILSTDQFEKLTEEQTEIYNNNIPQQYRNKLYIKTQNSNIYKIPNTNLLYKESGTCIDEIVGLKLPGILFPKRKVFIIKKSNQWREKQRIESSGYIMEYLKGYNLADENSKHNIFTKQYQDILKIYQILRKNLHSATELGYSFFDADIHNVIITKDNQPIVIDHDYTYLTYDIGNSKSKINSMHCYTLLNILGINENKDNFTNYKIDNKYMLDIIKNAKGGNIPADEFLEIINQYHLKLIGENIKTIKLARNRFNKI